MKRLILKENECYEIDLACREEKQRKKRCEACRDKEREEKQKEK